MYKINITYAYGTSVLHPEKVIHDPANDVWVHSAKLTIALNDAGSLSFETDITHEHADWIRENVMKFGWLVVVEDDDDVIWTGRIASVSTNRITGIISVECEGLLATLNDGVCYPYSFGGSPSGLLAKLLEHAGSSYDYEVGTVDIVDPNNYVVRSNNEYSCAWDEIRDKTFESSLGGFIFGSWNSETRKITIDWLEDSGVSGAQYIQYAQNLLDLEDTIDGTDFCTGIKPYGAVKDESSVPPVYVTLDDLSDQSIGDVDIIGNLGWVVLHSLYVDKGPLIKVVHFENATTVNGLKNSAVKYVKANLKMQKSVTIKAIDLSNVDPTTQRLTVGNLYNIVAPDTTMQLTLVKASLDLLHPESDDYEFGKLDRQTISSETGNTIGGSAGGGGGMMDYVYHLSVESSVSTENNDYTGVSGLLSDDLPGNWIVKRNNSVVVENGYGDIVRAPYITCTYIAHGNMQGRGESYIYGQAEDVKFIGNQYAYLTSSGIAALQAPQVNLNATSIVATSSLFLNGTYGLIFKDSGNSQYFAIRQGDSDLVIGYDNRTASYHHHVGRTFISSGYNTTTSKGYTSAYIMVPNDANTGGTMYSIFHAGYLDLSKATAGPVPSAYLPKASTSALGAVKVDGTTITIDSNGVISSSGGGGGGSVTGVKGNAESTYRTGNVNLTPANIGAAASSHNHAASDINSGTLDIARIPTGTSSSTVALGNHTHTASDITSGLATVATSGAYSDLSGLPTAMTTQEINDAVDAGWA